LKTLPTNVPRPLAAQFKEQMKKPRVFFLTKENEEKLRAEAERRGIQMPDPEKDK
jgi:hypothetical protein